MAVGKVFILGSGFSASMGLPTLYKLFNEIMLYPERPGEKDKEQIFRALEILYPHFKKTNSSSFPPFEEFLSIINISKSFEGTIYDKGFWEQKEKSALRILIDYIADASAEGETSELLNSFVKKLNYNDVIITFNWDNLIERALLKQGKSFNFKQRDDKTITLLKLHGSINWQFIPEDFSLKHPDSVDWLYQDRICHTKDYCFYDLWDSLDIPPFIVPPISSKRPSENNFLKQIWWEAFNSLIQAQKIAIIGYSIPNDDLQSRALLRSGILKTYIVIDPDSNVSGKYYTIINSDLEFHQEYFTQETLTHLF